MPGLGIPKRYGRWVARDDFVAYLEEYARRFGIEPRLGVRVDRIDRADGGWSLTTSSGDLEARRVAVATGYSNVPRPPDWPGVDGFRGELLHSVEYRNPEPFRGRDVLVVGTGNSGAEIAVDLVDGGAARVRLSVRTPPNIVRRDRFGIPAQVLGIVLGKLRCGRSTRSGERCDGSPSPIWASTGCPRPATASRSSFAPGRSRSSTSASSMQCGPAR